MFQSALTFGLTMVGAMDVYDHVFLSSQHPISLFAVIWYLITGIVVGFAGWNDLEGKYQNALIEARVKVSPGGGLPPRNSPLQITADSKPLD